MAQSVEDRLVVRMEASLRKFENQMAAGRKAATDAAVGSEVAWKKSGNQIAVNANRATTGLQRLTTISGRGRFVLQNTANQIGDMAVQMGAGTSGMRAMGLQMPQLLGGFGALGGTLGILGPLLGTVAALGFPLAAAFLMTGEKAKGLDDQLKALKESITAVSRAQDLASTSGADMLADYGSLADEAKAIFEINRQIASVRAQSALDAAARGVAAELGVEGVFGFGPDEVRDLDGTIANLKEQLRGLKETPAYTLSDSELAETTRQIAELEANLGRLKTVSGNIDDLEDALGISGVEGAAREVVAQFAAIGQAQGPRAQAQAMLDLADYINGVSGNLADAEDEGKALYDQLLAAAMQALELAKVDIAAPIEDGVDAATRLKNELATALALFNQVSLAGSKQYSGRGGDPRKVGNDQYTREMGYKPVSELIAEFTRSSGRSGRSGGGSARVDEGLREASRLFDQTRSEAERYAEELERIEDLHRRFPEVVTSEVRDRAVAALNDAGNSIKDISSRIESGFEDAFAAFVTGTGNARDAASALFADLARMAGQSAFKSLGVGSLLDGLFSGFSGFASGTSYAPGGLAKVGENGPELVNLPRGSQVIPAHQSKQMMGGANITFAPVIDARGADAGAVARLEGALARFNAEFEPRVIKAFHQGRKARMIR